MKLLKNKNEIQKQKQKTEGFYFNSDAKKTLVFQSEVFHRFTGNMQKVVVFKQKYTFLFIIYYFYLFTRKK